MGRSEIGVEIREFSDRRGMDVWGLWMGELIDFICRWFTRTKTSNHMTRFEDGHA